MADPVSIPINFKIYRKDATGKPNFLREEDFDQDVIKVGKGSAANLRLDDDSVALMHAYIQVNAEKEIFISDVVSKTGTFVNGEKVNKQQLKSGDEIVLGNCMLVINFTVESENVFAAAPEAGAGPAAAEGGAATFAADPSAMATYSAQPIDLSKVEDPTKKQAVIIKTFYDNKPVQTDVLRDHVNGEKKSPVSLISIVLGILLLGAGFYAGFKSVSIVHEEEAVNKIIKEIAKEQGLSDKFVPKVKGNIGWEMGFILLSLVGAGFFISGLAGLYKRKKTLANFTIGEDPEAVFSCSSKELPDHKFPLVSTDRSEGYHLNYTERMEGSVTDPSGNKYMLTELVQMGNAGAHGSYPATTDYPIPDNHTAEIRMGSYKWVISSVPQPKLALPFSIPKEVFYIQLFVWIAVVTMLAWYANFISKDELFSTDVDQQEVTVNTIVKNPNLLAKKEKKQKKQKVKDKDKQKDIYKKVKTKTKTDASAPRDPRNKSTSAGQGGAGVGNSRIAGPQGMGVANVLASKMNAMTASLTASNTVFGAETEDFDDLLGDGDPDGEASDGGFGGRGGAGGGGGGGGLGIGGGGGTGFGGIGIGGGGGLGGKFGRMGGIGKRRIRVRSGSAAVFGKLDPNEVRAVIRAHRREVHHCYQKGLMANDKLAGTVRVSFMINTTGRVQSCNVTENLAIPKVGACICGRLRTWKFPQPQGGLARVAYAWTLQPGG